jgi:hypothetical protein
VLFNHLTARADIAQAPQLRMSCQFRPPREAVLDVRNGSITKTYGGTTEIAGRSWQVE